MTTTGRKRSTEGSFVSDREGSATDSEKSPIIGFVVGQDDPVTMCGPCGAEEIRRLGVIRDSDHYGENVPYPECYKCGGVMRPDNNETATVYECAYCDKRFNSIRSVKDHSRNHNGEVDVPLFEVVRRD